MKSVLVTASSSTPISLAEAKEHLRVTTTGDNDYITELIKAAVERVEDLTGRKLMPQTWRTYYDEWPDSDSIELPYGPLIGVASTGIVYKDSEGSSTTLSSTMWDADTAAVPGRVCLDYNDDWPTVTLHNMNPISIDAEYGSTATSLIPHQLIHAAKILIGHWYEHREPIITGAIVSQVPMSVKALCAAKDIRGYR